MSNDEGTKYPTWKWILMIAIMLISFLSIKGISNIEARIDSKLEKELYNTEKLERDRITTDIKESQIRLELEMIKNREATNKLTTALIVHDSKIANFMRDSK